MSDSPAIAVSGPEGEQGIQGPPGNQGIQGEQGDPGEVEEAPINGNYYSRINGAWSINNPITDYVTLTTSQTISGYKNFTNGIKVREAADFGQVNVNTGLTCVGGADIHLESGGYLSLTSDPVSANQVGDRGYNDSRYLMVGATNVVYTTGNQTIGGTKNFNGTIQATGNVNFNALATDSSRFTWVNNAGLVYKSDYTIPALRDVRNALLGIAQLAGVSLVDVEALLTANRMSQAEAEATPD